MSELTTATGFELVEATHRHKPLGGDVEYRDVTDSVSIDRWTNYGKDRLYLNGLDTGDGWISLKGDDAGGDKWTKVDARRELEGDELTIEVYKGSTIYYTLVVRVHGDGFESAPEPRELDDELTSAATERHVCEACGEAFETAHGVAVHAGMVHSDDDASEQQVVTDGGEGVTHHVTDDDIEAAIRDLDDPDHPDALSVDDVRELLALIQRDVTEGWDSYMDQLEDGTLEVVVDHDDVIVVSAGEHKLFDEILSRVASELTDVEYDDVAADVVNAAIHNVADRLTDYNWGYSYPLILRKPADAEAGERYVQAAINSLLSTGLSPAEAWAYYGVELKGNSQSAWARRSGKDQSTVNRSLKRAKEKLPA